MQSENREGTTAMRKMTMGSFNNKQGFLREMLGTRYGSVGTRLI